jgi:myo-inositol 2-dehydrogenase/D-chiro-inositol 1-dehydrogenase
MDLISHLVSPVKKLTARKVEKQPGRLLIHAAFDFECGAIGTIAMGTMQSRGTPVERIELMGDHQRIEVEDIIDVRWHRNPAFKIDDPKATLSGACDTLSWRPNFTAAANEDPKGYHALLGDVVPALMGKETSAPNILDGVIAMERLETMRMEVEL